MTTTGLHLWTVDDYHRMIAADILTEEDKVELLEGQILAMSPQQPPHAATVQGTWKYLSRILADRADIRVQLPITIGPNSEPEPDIAVVRFDSREYLDGHPTPDDVFLLVEVADRSLSKDLQQKARIYGKNNILEYLVLDVNGRQVYVFREPRDSGYQEQMTLGVDGRFSLVAFPEVVVEVQELYNFGF
ncbi:MAG: Uma2 family endonuclease [Nostocaceae cyanobacterium]|nr:Uma2 family endonuclease [Nostocaceae cyanobacterium]